jgi:hypothetical protein
MLMLGASLWLDPLPMLGHWPASGALLAPSPLAHLLPTLSAMLGVLAGVLGMTSTPAPIETAPTASSPDALPGGPPPPTPSMEVPHDLSAAVAALRTLLAEERRELSVLRELSSNGTKESMMLAERLAASALDAELRLTASVVQAERALRYPSSAATRAAETTVRVERLLTRAETALRHLPEATSAATAAATALRQESAGLTEMAKRIITSQTNTSLPESSVEQAAAPSLPPAWPAELAALREAGKAITESAQDAVANLSQAAQATVGRLAAAVVAAVEVPTPRLETTTDAMPREIAELAAVTTNLRQAADALRDGTQTLQATGAHVEQAAFAFAERIAAEPRSHVASFASEAALRDLPDVAASLRAVVAELQRETCGLSATAQAFAALEPLVDQHFAAASSVTEAASRADQSTCAFEAANSTLTETADEMALQIARLAGIAGHAEVQAAVLPSLAAQMAEATGRLQAAAPAFDGVFDGALDGLDRVSMRLAQAVDALAVHDAPASLLARLDGLSAGIGAAIGRIEAALAQQGGTGDALLSGLNQIRASLTERAAPMAPDIDNPPSTLHQIDVVARETSVLLQQTEALAEAVVAGQTPGLPPLLTECTPALLAGVETTIARLRSVATALALASDGPPRPVMPGRNRVEDAKP